MGSCISFWDILYMLCYIEICWTRHILKSSDIDLLHSLRNLQKFVPIVVSERLNPSHDYNYLCLEYEYENNGICAYSLGNILPCYSTRTRCFLQ